MGKNSTAYFEIRFLDYTQEKQYKASILVLVGLWCYKNELKNKNKTKASQINNYIMRAEVRTPIFCS